MKNQYVGDISDFRKYGLIRGLIEPGELRVGCCWLLTPDDGSSDGEFKTYLADESAWRSHDPELFDQLRRIVSDSSKPGVLDIEQSGLLPRTTFFSEHVPDRPEPRRAYFERWRIKEQGTDLVFFDPDNGFEVKSKPRGRKNSSKFVFWDEVSASSRRGRSVLVYQHFARVKRKPFIDSIVRRMHQELAVDWVASFSTSHVLFLLAPAQGHLAHLADGCRTVADRWGDQFAIEIHRAF